MVDGDEVYVLVGRAGPPALKFATILIGDQTPVTIEQNAGDARILD